MGDLGVTSEFTISLLVLLVLVPLGGALYQWLASTGDARRFPRRDVWSISAIAASILT